MQKTTCEQQEDYEYALEVKEFYIVKTELTKNRTHQSYRWKEVAIGKTSEALEELMIGRNVRNMRIVKR